ncbi:maltose acetyltransferase domain-containing protein [Allosaccharopolyspora coralli]|uniref:maltose acetyltransferase domain-containing protein n=1 Tax=Allosaccharopolyspora coralli TaxID=2665642 RepID=UPI001E2F64B1|nr:maltose acetyltransferase domain-containing protein [Allosaccharopolyspora coralli]
MLRNEWYLDEPDLVHDRRRCWRLLDLFNDTRADDDAERQNTLHQLVGNVGDDVVVMPRYHGSYGTRPHSETVVSSITTPCSWTTPQSRSAMTSGSARATSS